MMEEVKQGSEEITESATNGSGEVPERGVFAFSVRQPNGSMTVSLRLIGDIDPLSVPSLLEHAQKVARQNIGLA